MVWKVPGALFIGQKKLGLKFRTFRLANETVFSCSFDFPERSEDNLTTYTLNFESCFLEIFDVTPRTSTVFGIF